MYADVFCLYMRKNGKLMACEHCGKLIYIPKYRQKEFRFCSHRCHGIVVMSSQEVQARIKRKTGKYHPRWKEHGSRRKDGYVLKTVDGVRGYEHRFVMEKHLGRKLIVDENIHHINGDKSDNRIENLKLYSTRHEHTIKEKHTIKFKYDRNEFKHCIKCGKKFYRWEKDHGKVYTFKKTKHCSRKCFLSLKSKNVASEPNGR